MSSAGIIRMDQTSITCTATCKDSKGNIIKPVLTWSLLTPGVATMAVSADTQSATFGPVADGVSNITAVANGVTGTGTITVTDGLVVSITLNFGPAS